MATPKPKVGPADTGGVLFIGICATPEEMKADSDEKLANTI
jgi:hypothetical protein